jgi:hypothetical protein
MLCVTCKYWEQTGYKNTNPDDDYPEYFCNNPWSERNGEVDCKEDCEDWEAKC